MCGICGIIGNRDERSSTQRVELMMDAMTHRGPDGDGAFAATGGAFGMRRLSIIDIPRGQQPIWNETGTMAVIFNGEIYNFQELRRSLESFGHIFSTNSDTEVLVHAYESWGSDCLRRLRGMFAFAIVELTRGAANSIRRVFLARDRMGIKPLYYTIAGGRFLFASEVRALLASGCVSRRLSTPALHSYLLFGSVCEPMTIVDGVHSLPPGHFGFVLPESPTSFSAIPYWSIDDTVQPSDAYLRNHTPETVRAALEDSVHHHLLADVPVGVFLSSGIDSTALAAIASKQTTKVKTLTVAFSEQEFSEAEQARSIAAHLATQHSEFLLTGEEMRARLDEAIASFDQPSVDGINTFFISWAASQAGLKVALSGLGSDEIFGGYSTFRDTARLARIAVAARYLPISFRKRLTRLALSQLPGNAGRDRIHKAAAGFTEPDVFPHPYFFTRVLFVPQIANQLLRLSSDEWRQSGCWQWLVDAAEEASQADDFTSVSWLEIRSYLVNMLLRDTDTMSMRHSLEVRVPFLDDPLLKLALCTPRAAKRKNGAPKSLLLEALGNLLPESIVRHPKRTFTLPWEVWLRGPLRERVRSSLSNCDPCVASIIDMNEAMRIWQDFLAGRTSWSRPWSFFVLNEWVKRNIANSPATLVSERTAAAPAVL